jgi:hypothetical protein
MSKTTVTEVEYMDGKIVRSKTTITETIEDGNWHHYATSSPAKFDPSKCPCNPALGGSGICGCVMSSPTITCSTNLDGQAIRDALLKVKRSGGGTALGLA